MTFSRKKALVYFFFCMFRRSIFVPWTLICVSMCILKNVLICWDTTFLCFEASCVMKHETNVFTCLSTVDLQNFLQYFDHIAYRQFNNLAKIVVQDKIKRKCRRGFFLKRWIDQKKKISLTTNWKINIHS